MKMKKSFKRKVLTHLFVLLLLVFCVWGAIHLFLSSYNLCSSLVLENETRHSRSDHKELTLTLSPGSSLLEVSDALAKHGVIKSQLLFLAQGYLHDYYSSLQPGTYTFDNTLNNIQILEQLTPDMKPTSEPIRLTIPEGFTLTDIAEKVESLGICTKNEFIEATYTGVYPHPFLSKLPDDLSYKLEGYLFPDTYFVTQDSTPEEIITMMLNRFETIVMPYLPIIENNGYSIHDIVTIASIIENEARVDEERPIISGVIYNRLNANMKLQMCSTVQYILENRKQALTYDDLAIESPYNTYLCDALPIGPISSPGQASLLAAIEPSEHDYFFFVLKDSNAGTHVFSKTGAEHLNHKSTYQSSDDHNFLN